MPFSKKIVENLLVACNRCCCICHSFCGPDIEVHHIVPISEGGMDTEDNGIPLCYTCHAAVHAYSNSPKGRKYTRSELCRHRDEWFSSCRVNNHEELERVKNEIIGYLDSLRIPEIHDTLINIAETIDILKNARNNESTKNKYESDKGINLITDPTYYARLGALELEYKNYKDAVRLLSRSLEMDGKQPAVYFNLFKAYLYLGDLSKAYDAYSKANSLDPSLCILPEKYKILSVLGRGRIATVYKAEDITKNKLVAIKVLNGEYIQDFMVASSFENESRILSLVNHRSLLKLIEQGKYKKRSYIAYEYVEAKSLYDIILEKTLTPSDVCNIALEIASAIKHLHNNSIVHRDIKPQNILIHNYPTDIRLIDFAFSALLDPSITSSTMVNVGTIAYMAPELYSGLSLSTVGTGPRYLPRSKIDLSSVDIYCFGATLFHAITGELPKMDYNIKKIPEGFAKNFWELVLRMLSSEPSKRPCIDEVFVTICEVCQNNRDY